MDQHFLRASVEDNQPLQYALMMHDALMNQQLKALIVLPYAHRLRGLPDYLQQLWMESLGKSVDAQGEKINHPTGPIVFGSVGTNSQHSFQQLMMQGSHPIFADFILPLEQTNMIANCLMQVKTLRDGVETQNPLKQITGNKIANLFVLDQLNLKTLGALLAFYEHAVVSLAYILKVNPFDQFGVEHAKVASANLIKELGMKKVAVDQVKQILNN
jgi:glucose-6-phosphate isomerase